MKRVTERRPRMIELGSGIGLTAYVNPIARRRTALLLSIHSNATSGTPTMAISRS